MKLLLNIIFILLLFSKYSLSDSSVERKFIIEGKFGILPSIQLMEINTKLNVKEENFDYIFDIKSKNIVKFINETNGRGTVNGKYLNNKYIPFKYEYSYKRKEKNKYVEIIYKDKNVEKITITPKYDKSKLTPLTEEMLKGTIDPPTFFLSILNFKNINNCQKTFKVFDGKRRYDVKFSKSNALSDTVIECEAIQIKLGGYKNKENDIFAASDFIKIVYDKKNNNKFIRYEAKNGSINVLIEEIKIN